MDETRKNTFTLGKGDNALPVTIAQPGAGQMMILAMSRTGTNTGEMSRLISRILRVIEVLAGDDWGKIEDAMLTERVDPLEFMDLAKAVLTFDWAAEAERVKAGDALQDALDREAAKRVAEARHPEPGEVAAFLAKQGLSASGPDTMDAYEDGIARAIQDGG